MPDANCDVLSDVGLIPQSLTSFHSLKEKWKSFQLSSLLMASWISRTCYRRGGARSSVDYHGPSELGRQNGRIRGLSGLPKFGRAGPDSATDDASEQPDTSHRGITVGNRTACGIKVAGVASELAGYDRGRDFYENNLAAAADTSRLGAGSG
jgi:hypothetical protein